jgi:hypothetical protein
MSIDVAFNGHKDDDYIPGKPRHNARHARTPVARLRAHAELERAWREAEVADRLAGFVRDAVVSFKAGR